jgi:RNA polymerase sigma-70 factor (ECF subfamily)
MPIDERNDPDDAPSIDWPEILRMHGPAVWRTIYRILGSADDARDCYQDTLLAAVQTARRGTVDNWGAFLRSLATRRAIDHLRRRHVRRRRWRLGLGPDDHPVAPDVPRDAHLDGADLCDRVRLLLAEVPPRQAQAFWMRHMEQMSLAEIAGHLGTAPGNVSVLLNRAAAHLRRALEPMGPTAPDANPPFGKVTL